jgi:hypothetical protein
MQNMKKIYPTVQSRVFRNRFGATRQQTIAKTPAKLSDYQIPSIIVKVPFYPQKLALPSPTSGGRSVGIVRSRTKATEVVS